MKKHENEMSHTQQVGMVTLISIVKALINYGIDFEIDTKETQLCIQKSVMINESLLIDGCVGINQIRVNLYPYDETKIYFVDLAERITEADCFIGFEKILDACEEWHSGVMTYEQ